MYRDVRIERIVNEAYILGRDLILSDPTTDTILIAAAEAAGDTTTDLSKLRPNEVSRIVQAYDRGQESLA
jgi:hypothetical protein